MRTVVFDLDGTLTDPFDGITRSIVYAVEKSGLTPPDPSSLGWAIGPALIDSFTQMGAADPQQVLGYYRERYTDVGLFENRVYPGTIEALTALHEGGHRMFLMTAKPHVYAKRITAHFGIAPFLEAEFGPELDGTRNDKAELLAHALDLTGVAPERSVMIGDRRHDHAAARKNRLTSVAVSWGYGTDDEHGLADHICHHLPGLPMLIQSIQAG